MTTAKADPQIRTISGTFKKGHSGNPGGRPKDEIGLRDLARGYSTSAIETLYKVMTAKRSPAAARVSAACALLDRGYGKPIQTSQLTGKDGGPIELNDVTDMELARRVAFLLNSADHELTETSETKGHA